MRIGIVTNILDEEYQNSLYRGISNRSKELGIELICFQQENFAFNEKSFISKIPDEKCFGIEGIILLSTVICDHLGEKSRTEFNQIWGHVPVVSIGQQLKGVPSLLIKAEDSMKKLVEHLLNVHSYKNFLYISGPANHNDNALREKIFLEILNNYKNKNSKINYVIKRGDFTEYSSLKIMTDFKNENSDFKIDAVVCANDNMAIGVYKYLKMNKNDRSYQEIAVTGFDDIPQSELEFPSITTVHQPLEEMGIKSVDLLKDLINGKKVDETNYLYSNLILRESCGCNKHKAEEKNYYYSEVKKLMYEYLHSELRLRNLSRMGQELNVVNTFDCLNYYIGRYLEEMEIQTFIILLFSSKSTKNNIYVKPLFIKKDGVILNEKYQKKRVLLGDFFKEINSGNPKSDSYTFKYISSGDEIMGCALYQSKEQINPSMCSIIVDIAQTIKRLQSFGEKIKRSEYLEKEVSKRTKELIEANNKRIEVEAEVLKISELERQRFSIDLHDDICQRLAGISMLCRSYASTHTDGEKEEMAEIATLISETLQCTRQYAHNSYPVELDTLGMNHSLSNLCNSFSVQFNIKCYYKWSVQNTIELNSIQKLNSFRIIQEALHNISKHAKASSVYVSVSSVKDYIIITVVDNGCGISDLVKIKKGLGLNSMQYRADQIGAEFKIYRNNLSGTCVEIKFLI